MTDALSASLQRALGDAYRIDRELGGGGMSRVFVARDLSLDREVVVKVLSEDATAGVSGDRFRREIQVIAKLQHPHVVSILAAGSADGSLYYVMPFVSGETLRARIAREGALPLPDVVRLLREVLDALAFAHERGVAHRDIKPENVLVEAGHAVVADFGIAKALSESGTMTSAGFAVGTPAYMAPEQATADPTTDHRADLYAVGVVGYELLTGRPLFAGSAQQLITAHLTAPVPNLRALRADVPEPLATLITRALAKEPDQRPQSAREMIATLDVVSTPSAISVGASVAARGTPSRAKWPFAVGAAALLAVVAYLATGARTTADAAPSVVIDGADLIAVMPLSAVSDTSLARLGQDLVVTLSANLDGVGSLTSVDAITLLMRARELPSPLPLRDAQMLARELGARSVLTGTLIRAGSMVRASVTLHRVGSDVTLARAEATAAPEEIAALTDSLSWSVLRQVWQEGTPPSPVLTGLTTASFDALREFLDGERAFQKLDTRNALLAYGRAIERDSGFAQALLRHDYVNAWSLNPPDPYVRGRLLAVLDKLPERERLWTQTEHERLPFTQKLAKWRELVSRYPDYPPVLMSAADMIIHEGAAYGVPLAESRPMLERLATLVPDHADTKFHIAAVEALSGTDEAAIAAFEAASASMTDGFWSESLRLSVELRRATGGGPPASLEQIERTGRAVVEAYAGQQSPVIPYISGMLVMVEWNGVGPLLDAIKHLRDEGIYAGTLDRAASWGEGHLLAARGDWNGSLRALQRSEGSVLGAAAPMASARLAVLGAWLGGVESDSADVVLARVRRASGINEQLSQRIELNWLDGLLGVVVGDSARVSRMSSAVLRDTLTGSRLARAAAASLDGAWLARTRPDDASAALRVQSESAMSTGGFLLPIEVVNRLIVARGLRRQGKPEEAERYLQWLDAGYNVIPALSTSFGVGALASYERGVALDEAGKSDAAAVHLLRFVRTYDTPPPAHETLVADAKERLTRLSTADAARRPRTITSPK